jgi:murein DD-endopeptidase MepM/ murein hydrolase activator NlpD
MTEPGYGNHIVIRHGYGYETLYAHLQIQLNPGQRIKREILLDS